MAAQDKKSKPKVPKPPGPGMGGIQVLRKGPANADGSHNIQNVSGASQTGIQVHQVGADGVYRDNDGNVAIDPTNQDKELLHLKKRGFYHKKRLIFEWRQTLEDVTLYITPPKHIKGKDLNIVLKTKWITVGLKGMKPFIDEELSHPIDSSSSTWFLDDDGVCISLTKQNMGVSWQRVIGRQQAMNQFEAEKIKKSMMLERFARENPHMDFSGAKFGGQCPEPTQFLDGIDTNRFHKDI
mmetsp:Transcript_49991/g.83254  ORF Transcript_49991/g.83254 Transcript_49991/m.83254 type:complete len:239 (-) Transcript_49991:136-852(-)|eukprot:CAMPEP_0202713412 /NCGR_PEP_ID=MMETSP1385-20130828/53434_1 /ASSEMBLY_ACC=CAM_ASM_000861 /TAXON_ID=933848 /ORGANISM="Elphidium margaritaceum" /LENGTH=238 /DNA_ID=CAMNT_0049373747 /DNA_START=27 /DNA_END=743 /DNA_ORIENTATION=+